MRHITFQPSDRIPRDEEFAFRARARALVEKWHVIIYNAENGERAGTNNTAPSEANEAGEDATNGAAATSVADAPVADGTTAVDVTDHDRDVDVDDSNVCSNAYVWV